jgi:hypothetical protein
MNAFAQNEQQSTGAIPKMKIESTHTIVSTLDNPVHCIYIIAIRSNYPMLIPAGTPFTTLGSFTFQILVLQW